MIFLSHSSVDNADALQLRDWLFANGWTHFFLDLDPRQGLAPGQLWRNELQRAGHECEAVIILVSPAWAASKWCLSEFLLARQLGKPVFPVLICPTPKEDLPDELLREFQYVDLSAPAGRMEGLDRLAIGLRRAGIDPAGFPWPPSHDPHRLPYRGLETYEPEDAAVYFGRQEPIARALEDIRSPTNSGLRMIIILGASGSGKSSYLRAGLISRLSRLREEFEVLPVVRPADAISFTVLPRTATDPPARRRILAIDQAEEIFQKTREDQQMMLSSLRAAIDADVQLLCIMTIRSDNFHQLQNAAALSDVAKMLIDLPSIPIHSWPEVIQKPAEVDRRGVSVAPQLVNRIIQDFVDSDTLPLLSYTLRQLYVDARPSEMIGVSHYLDAGGLSGTLDRQLSRVARAWDDKTGDVLPLADAISMLFIPWLVTADIRSGDVRRRKAWVSEIPREVRGLADLLLGERLLTSSTREAQPTLEVAHESIFKVWSMLQECLRKSISDVSALEDLKSSAENWERRGQLPLDLIYKGDRLGDIVRVLDRFPSSVYQSQMAIVTYLWECYRADFSPARRTRYLLLFAWLLLAFGSLRLR